MKIDPTSSIGRAAPKRSVKKTEQATGDFASTLAGDGDVASVGGGKPMGAVDTLLALQEIPDSLAGRAQARRRADDLLDRLDEIRIGLLTGQLPRSQLEALARLLAARKGKAGDPRLAQLLDEIELRAAVELAKLGL